MKEPVKAYCRLSLLIPPLLLLAGATALAEEPEKPSEEQLEALQDRIEALSEAQPDEIESRDPVQRDLREAQTPRR